MNPEEVIKLRVEAMGLAVAANEPGTKTAQELCEFANVLYSWMGSSEPPTGTGTGEL